GDSVVSVVVRPTWTEHHEYQVLPAQSETLEAVYGIANVCRSPITVALPRVDFQTQKASAPGVPVRQRGERFLAQRGRHETVVGYGTVAERKVEANVSVIAVRVDVGRPAASERRPQAEEVVIPY